ncbi:hypothetical protein ACS0PU_012191 [Formica fusca]
MFRKISSGISLVGSSFSSHSQIAAQTIDLEDEKKYSLSLSFSFTRFFVSDSLVAPKSDAKDSHTRETVAQIVVTTTMTTTTQAAAATTMTADHVRYKSKDVTGKMGKTGTDTRARRDGRRRLLYASVVARSRFGG